MLSGPSFRSPAQSVCRPRSGCRSLRCASPYAFTISTLSPRSTRTTPENPRLRGNHVEFRLPNGHRPKLPSIPPSHQARDFPGGPCAYVRRARQLFMGTDGRLQREERGRQEALDFSHGARPGEAPRTAPHTGALSTCSPRSAVAYSTHALPGHHLRGRIGADRGFRLDGADPEVDTVDRYVLVIRLTDEQADADLEIGSGEERYLLPADLVNQFAAPSPAAARPLALPGSRIPQPSTFSPRVSPRRVKPLADGVLIAGTPGATEVPVNFVGERLTATYLTTDLPLGGEDYASGHLRQFDTYWEPLGWALDEWIDTISLAPFEDTIESGINVASMGRRGDEFDERRSTRSVRKPRRRAQPPRRCARPRRRHLRRAALRHPSEVHPRRLRRTCSWRSRASWWALPVRLRERLDRIAGRGGRRPAPRRHQPPPASDHRSARNQQSVAREHRERCGVSRGAFARFATSAAGRSENLALFSVVRQWLVSPLSNRGGASS